MGARTGPRTPGPLPSLPRGLRQPMPPPPVQRASPGQSWGGRPQAPGPEPGGSALTLQQVLEFLFRFICRHHGWDTHTIYPGGGGVTGGLGTRPLKAWLGLLCGAPQGGGGLGHPGPRTRVSSSGDKSPPHITSEGWGTGWGLTRASAPLGPASQTDLWWRWNRSALGVTWMWWIRMRLAPAAFMSCGWFEAIAAENQLPPTWGAEGATGAGWSCPRGRCPPQPPPPTPASHARLPAFH